MINLNRLPTCLYYTYKLYSTPNQIETKLFLAFRIFLKNTSIRVYTIPITTTPIHYGHQLLKI